MHLTKKKNKLVAESFKNIIDISAYIRYIVNIYSASEIKRELWLTEREKDFFVATTIHILQGISNPISEDALQIYKKYFHPQNNNRKTSDYLNRLEKKKWVKYDSDEKTVQIPAIFDEMDLNENMVDFNLRFSYNERKID